MCSRWGYVKWGQIGVFIDGQAGPCMGRCMDGGACVHGAMVVVDKL